MKEHVGRMVGRYYQNVVEAYFGEGPDLERVSDDGARIRRFIAPQALFTEVTPPNGAAGLRYMRLYGLGRCITRFSELALIGVPSGESYPDLVIAAPWQSVSDFHIIVDEMEDFRSLKKRLQDEDDRRLMVTTDRYKTNIYQHLQVKGSLSDIGYRLPQTSEACLSLAGLIVLHDLNISDTPNEAP